MVVEFDGSTGSTGPITPSTTFCPSMLLITAHGFVSYNLALRRPMLGRLCENEKMVKALPPTPG